MYHITITNWLAQEKTYTLINAEPASEILISLMPITHLIKEQLRFYPEMSWFRSSDFFLYQFINKIVGSVTKCLKWVMF